MFRLIKIFLTIIIFTSSFSIMGQQSYKLQKLENKIKLAELLLAKQYSRDELNSAPPVGLKVVKLSENEYRFKDNYGSLIIAHLHIETHKIVYVEFTEEQSLQHELYSYLLETKKFEWLGTEHNCDYMNNKKISISVCPGQGDVFTIQVSKYQM